MINNREEDASGPGVTGLGRAALAKPAPARAGLAELETVQVRKITETIRLTISIYR